MFDDTVYQKLADLREEYRRRMNLCAEAAQIAAQEEQMDIVSMHSSESERCREAFNAVKRAIKIIEND